MAAVKLVLAAALALVQPPPGVEHAVAGYLRGLHAAPDGGPYWRDARIHNLGNHGWAGWLHAAMAPAATHLIDRWAYGGVDARKCALGTIPSQRKVVDLCCGTGYSTARHTTRTVGVDTSPAMLAVARLAHGHAARFVQGDAERWGTADMCDTATVMYALHEMPRGARRRVLRNALRLARESVVVVDICPTYRPGPMMLSGEPYLPGYLRHADEDVRRMAEVAGWPMDRVALVPGHVVLWRIRRDETSCRAQMSAHAGVASELTEN